MWGKDIYVAFILNFIVLSNVFFFWYSLNLLAYSDYLYTQLIYCRLYLSIICDLVDEYNYFTVFQSILIRIQVDLICFNSGITTTIAKHHKCQKNIISISCQSKPKLLRVDYKRVLFFSSVWNSVLFISFLSEMNFMSSLLL